MVSRQRIFSWLQKYFERIGDHATNIAEWVEFALDDKVRKIIDLIFMLKN